jgi:cation diffusion facilitator CzcD-associated flavoprotein CzcO
MARTVRIAIIGAGLGGIAAGVKLRQAGIDSFTIFERASGPGGVWYHNSYPGCEVDVPSRAYSYSFMPYDWSGRYAKQAELRQYARDVIDRFSLSAHVKYNTFIECVRWNEEANGYTLTTTDGDSYKADLCVSAVGLLTNPKYPGWPGLDTFKGSSFHTAEFDHDVPLDGKTVAIVGTGSSSCQIAPAIASEVHQLYVYQREAAHVLPKRTVTYDERTRARYRRFPILQRLERIVELQRAVSETKAIDLRRPEHEHFERYFEKYLARSVADPQTREALRPKYPYGCKRPIFASGYYEIFNRENVELVPHPVASVTPRGLVDATGAERPVDVIIIATGFHVADFLSTLNVEGPGGLKLADYWRDEPWAFLGMTVPGFPNFMMMYGPNTNGIPSIISYLEIQADVIVRMVRRLSRSETSRFDTNSQLARRIDSWTQRQLEKYRSVAATGCHNYNLAPTGRNVSQWPRSHYIYHLATRVVFPVGIRCS